MREKHAFLDYQLNAKTCGHSLVFLLEMPASVSRKLKEGERLTATLAYYINSGFQKHHLRTLQRGSYRKAGAYRIYH